MTTPTIYGGLRAYYKFEETPGQPVRDYAQLGSPDGVLTNAIQVAGGKIGAQGLRTSLAAGNMTVPQNPYLNATVLISVSVWVNLDMALDVMWGTPVFADKTGGLTSGYVLGVLTGGTKDVSFRVFNSAGTPYSATYTEVATSGWIHYVGVYEASLVKLYRNGTLVASAVADGTQRFNYAADLVSGVGFQGVIDELQVWDLRLTAGNVTTLYNAGNGLEIVFPEGFTGDIPDEGSYLAEPYPEVEIITGSVPAAVSNDAVPMSPGAAFGQSMTMTPLGSIFAPYTVKDLPTTEYVDPVPTVVSITVNGSHHITATANAGPTDAGPLTTWWEIYLSTGDVVVTADRITAQVFDSNHNHVDVFDVPLGQSWNGLNAKFFMEAIADASQVWSSPVFVLNDDNFNNIAPVVIPTFIDPMPVMGMVSVV